MQDVKDGICGVNCHIENAKNEIINNMSCGVNPCVATKQDIADAVTKINAHTDEKFNEVDFLKQFSDLRNGWLLLIVNHPFCYFPKNFVKLSISPPCPR